MDVGAWFSPQGKPWILTKCYYTNNALKDLRGKRFRAISRYLLNGGECDAEGLQKLSNEGELRRTGARGGAWRSRGKSRPGRSG